MVYLLHNQRVTISINFGTLEFFPYVQTWRDFTTSEDMLVMTFGKLGMHPPEGCLDDPTPGHSAPVEPSTSWLWLKQIGGFDQLGISGLPTSLCSAVWNYWSLQAEKKKIIPAIEDFWWVFHPYFHTFQEFWSLLSQKPRKTTWKRRVCCSSGPASTPQSPPLVATTWQPSTWSMDDQTSPMWWPKRWPLKTA